MGNRYPRQHSSYPRQIVNDRVVQPRINILNALLSFSYLWRELQTRVSYGGW
jgi:hypothetical protein